MLYDAYEAKMNKIAVVLDKIRKHRVLISVCLAIILLAIGALLFVKGMLIGDALAPTSIMYGDKMELKGEAILGKTYTQYRPAGEGEWQDGVPSVPGEYEVRLVSNRSFGAKDYGEVQSVTVQKRPLKVSLSSTAVYGEYPEAYSEGLISGDRLDSSSVTYSAPYAESSEASISSVVILNGEGKDVTYCYEAELVGSTVTFGQRPITVRTESAEKVYDGTPLRADGVTISLGTAAYSDKLEYNMDVSVTDAVVGSVQNRPAEIKILNSDGEDVTGRYIITEEIGTLTVHKRSITLESGSVEKIYDALPISGALVRETEGSFADGQRAEYELFTDGVINVGSYENRFQYRIIDKNGNDVGGNYNVTERYGALKIDPRPVTVTGSNRSWIFDGYTHRADTLFPRFTVSDAGEATGLVAGHDLDCNTFASIIRVGETENLPTDIRITDESGSDVTYNYDVSAVSGRLSVIKRAVKLTVLGSTYVYTGAEMGYFGADSSGEHYELALGAQAELPEGMAEDTAYDFESSPLGTQAAVLTCLYDGSAVRAGTVKVKATSISVFIYGDDYSDCYDITAIDGSIEIVRRKITLTPESVSAIYNGKTQRLENLKTVAYWEDTVSQEPMVINVNAVTWIVSEGVSARDYVSQIVSYRLETDGGEDITDCFEVTSGTGVYTIDPRPIKITLNSNSWIYDGVAHLLSGAEAFTVTSLVENDNVALGEGHTVELSTLGSITDVGEELHTCLENAIIKDENGNPVTENYVIEYENGLLTVTPRPLIVQVGSATKIYDGTPLTSEEFWVVLEGEGMDVVSGQILTVMAYGSQKNVGSSENNGVATVMAGDRDVTFNYDITYVLGTLTVTPRPLIIQIGSDTRVYDGTPLTNGEYWESDSEESMGVVSGQSLTVVAHGSQTNVGSSANNGTATVIADGEDVTSNYDITVLPGTLTVTHRYVTLQLTDAEKVYDGKPLTSNAYMVADGSIVDGQLVTIAADGSQTNVGSSANNGIATVMADGEDVTSNYVITVLPGTLTVTKRAVTLKLGDAEKVYDGTPLRSNGYTVVIGSIVEGQIATIDADGSQTNVGSSANNGIATVMADGEDVTSNYDITVLPGTLTVTLRYVTLQLTDAEKIYDGKPLTSNAYTVVYGSMVEGQVAAIVADGSQTDVGSSVNNGTATVMADGEDVTYNYVITVLPGTLTVTPRPITVTTASDTKIYDGTPLTNGGCEWNEEDLAEGQTITVNVTGSQTNAGSCDNICSVIIMAGDRDVTFNYDITYVLGTLTVTPRPLIIQIGSDTRVYDGTPLTNGEYWESDSEESMGLVSGQELIVITHGSQTNVGSSANNGTATVMADGEDVTSNYDITVLPGTLTVTHRYVTLQLTDAEKVYDGKPLTSNAYTVADGSIVDGQLATIAADGSQTNVGSSANNGIATVIANGEDVTSNYVIAVLPGTLTVTKRAVILQLTDANKVYDGTPLTSNAFTEAEGSIVAGQIAAIVADGSQTNVGSSANNGTATVMADGEDVTSNYDITVLPGILTVTHRYVTLQLTDAEKIYDGKPLTSNAFTEAEGSIAAGQIAAIVADGSQTDVGSSVNNGTATVMADGEDVTYNYVITVLPGTLTVTPRPITVTTASDTKIYDGTSLTNGGCEWKEEDLAEGQTITVNVTGSQTNAGSSDNTCSVIIMAGDRDVTFNYDITYALGTLTVTPRPIMVTTASDTKIYDGTPLTNGGCGWDEECLAEGQTITVKVNGKRTDVGSANNTCKVTIMAGDENVTENYDITYVLGTLTVTPRPITVTTESATKTYDGTPLTNGECEWGEEDLADGQSITVKVTGSQTDAGSSDNTCTVTIMAGDEDVTKNYDITYVLGTLTVNRRKVTLQLTDANKVYDGTPLTSNAYTEAEGSIADGQVATIAADGSQTNVGSSANNGIATVMAGKKDVTSNYDITVLPGTLTVTKRAVTLQLTDAEKVYDGTPLTSNAFTEAEGSIVAGQIATIVADGSQTNVGSSANNGTATVMADGEDVTSNYDITVLPGKLTVTSRFLTVTADSAEKIYDGTPLVKKSCSITSGEKLVSGDSLITTIVGSQTEIGSSENIIVSYKVVNENGEDVTENYVIETMPGTLTVRAPEGSGEGEGDGDGEGSGGGGGSGGGEGSGEGGGDGDGEGSGGGGGNGDGEGSGGGGGNGEGEGSGEGGGNGEGEGSGGGGGNGDGEGSGGGGGNGDGGGSGEGGGNGDGEGSGGGGGNGDGGGSGEGGGSGGNGDLGGDIGNEKPLEGEGGGTDSPIFTFISDANGAIYFRQKHFGAYSIVDGWLDAPAGEDEYTYAMISDALKAKKVPFTATVRPAVSSMLYLTPYYAEKTTVGVGRVTDEYSVEYYKYDYLKEDAPALDAELAAYEANYRVFAKANYLALPDSTRAEMLAIIAEAAAGDGKDLDNMTLKEKIEWVCNYVKNARPYDLQFEDFPDDVDKAIYFLTEAESGVCRHFASSATVMYRALGIPARYTVGYYGVAEAGKEVAVTAMQAHAWVEVYVDGLGWVVVDPTGSSNGGGPGGGGVIDPDNPDNPDEPDEPDEPNDKPTITIALGNVTKKYTGQPITCNNSNYWISSGKEFLPEGYTCSVVISGSQTEVGTTSTKLGSVVILDAEGNDITDNYNFEYQPGVIEVIAINITVSTGSATKSYDGSRLECKEANVSVGRLLAGHKLVVTNYAYTVNIGTVNNTADIDIVDENGNSVKSCYNIKENFGKLIVE